MFRWIACIFVVLMVPCSAGVAPAAPADPRIRDGFFAMNGIAPFHERAAGTPEEQIVANLEKNLGKIREDGAVSVRIDMWWGMIEPQKGNFDWPFPDRVIDTIVKAGLEPYPILCYAPAWNPDVSPATPEAREEYGLYVRNVVSRYKDRVRRWEVWNEPNTPPFWVPQADPQAYAALLQVAYGEAKKADPTCLVVGMCTAGPDYDFIERAYRAGAAGSLDAVSYHHYSSVRDEAVLENEIRTVRRIMERYGDGGKPLLITELGLSTTPSEIVEQYSPEEQAAGIVVKHLVARAEGVQRLYYFKLQDDPASQNPDGGWGILNSDGTPKPSWAAYTTLTGRTGGAAFVGRAARMAQAPERRDDVEFHVYTRDGETLAAAWVRASGGPLDIRVPADAPVVMEDCLGRQVDVLQPGAEKFVTVPLTACRPVWLRGLSPRVRALASVHFDPPRVAISPGESRTVKVRMDNPLDTPLKARLDPFRWEVRGRVVSATAPAWSLTAPPQASTEMEITLSLPPDVDAFDSFAYEWNDQMQYTYSLPVEFAPLFDLSIKSQMDGAGAVAVTRVRNAKPETMEANLTWIRPGGTKLGPSPIPPLSPGDQVEFTLPLTIGIGPAELESTVSVASGARARGRLRLYGQPHIRTPIKVDGDLTDWPAERGIDVSVPNDLLPRAGRRNLDGLEGFGAHIQVAWSDTDVCIAAAVRDSTPMINPHERSEIWRGDGLEIYLGLQGPSTAESYGPGQVQLGLSPGNDGHSPSVWNWKAPLEPGANDPAGGRAVKGAEIVSRRTADGYLIEASLPLQALGIAPRPDVFLGFDVHVNNATSAADREASGVLSWNGGATNWRDPSRWGVAKIVRNGNP